jgi:hypothetical protein
VSVDAAWRYTIGNSNVVLAILDDGISWGDRELRGRIVLNPGELQSFPPSHADQSPCAPLVPGDPNSPRFDCSVPPDGVVTLDDYVEKLGWNGSDPQDPNGNHVLDPEDIFSLAKNQRDDDGNGLTDDIAGWDFIDNNPTPSHQNARHGTEAALDAMAQTNDNIGRAGACPRCVTLPIRIAEQRGADPQSLALGILYAASRGAAAALVGHLPLGRSETLEHAIAYAAQRGMLVLFPNDGEQQTVPQFTLNTDAWLPLGSVTTRNDSELPTRATTFIALDPCQSLPSGPLLASAGPSCTRRSYSVALGVAGLVASAADFARTPTRLTALELAATLRSAADPVNTTLAATPEEADSRVGDVRRLNANTAVELVREDLAPAELNVERPYWYEALVLDRTKTPFELTGHLTAKRANSVDLSISAAEGQNPRDAAYRTLYTKKAWVGSTANDSVALATIDLRTWYQSLHADFDPEASIQALVSLRIKATAHYSRSGSERSIETQVDRPILLLKDPDLMANAPLRVASRPTAPKLADVDGDDVADIVLGTLDGRIIALKPDTNRIKEIAATPVYTHLTDKFDQLVSQPLPASILAGTAAATERWGHDAIASAPAIADLDADGTKEIVAVTMNGLIYAVHADGTYLPGYNPLRLPEPTRDCRSYANETECGVALSRLHRGSSSSPVLADVNGDGHLDVVIAAHDGRIHAYNSAAKPIPGWPLLVPVGADAQPGPLMRSPAVGDFNGDSIDDLLVTVGELHRKNFGRGLATIVLGARAPDGPRIADGWPVGVDTYDFEVDRLDRSTPGGAVDGASPAIRALLYGNSSQPFFLPLQPGSTQESDPESHTGQLPAAAEPLSTMDGRLGFDLSSYGTQSTFVGQGAFAPLLARPSLGDLDRDGQTDVVLTGISLDSLFALRDNSSSAAQLAQVALFNGSNGQMLPAAPVALESFVGSTGATIADLTNDGYPEVIVPNGAGALLAIDACGRSAPGWPKWVGGAIHGAAAVGDVDGDGRLEVVATTEAGWVYVWKTAALSNSYVPWGSEMADAQNSSRVEPVGSNVTPNLVWPLPLNASGKCAKPPAPPNSDPRLSTQSSARGGCTCSLASRPSNAYELLLAGLGLCALRGLRSRKRA